MKMRYLSIDILRTVAIFLMVIVHFVENLSGSKFVPSGFGAPLFTFLSGVSYQLWVNSQVAKGKTETEISKITIRRGLFIFGVGFLFNVFVWLPEDTFNWDILTFIGAAMMFLNLVRNLPTPIPILMCAAVYLLSPILRAMTDYPAFWINGYFESDLTLADVLLGFAVNGFFPIFPWIIYPVAGFVVARAMFPEARRSATTLNWLVAIGLLMLVTSSAMLLLRAQATASIQAVWLKGWTMFPASTEYVLGTLGFAIAAFVCAYRWIDLQPRIGKSGWLARIPATYSTHSFTIYLLHHVVHLWPLWLYGLAYGTEPTQYWRAAVSVSWSWQLACGFLVLCYALLRWMEHMRTPSMESAMRWLCD